MPRLPSKKKQKKSRRKRRRRTRKKRGGFPGEPDEGIVLGREYEFTEYETGNRMVGKLRHIDDAGPAFRMHTMQIPLNWDTMEYEAPNYVQPGNTNGTYRLMGNPHFIDTKFRKRPDDNDTSIMTRIIHPDEAAAAAGGRKRRRKTRKTKRRKK